MSNQLQAITTHNISLGEGEVIRHIGLYYNTVTQQVVRILTHLDNQGNIIANNDPSLDGLVPTKAVIGVENWTSQSSGSSIVYREMIHNDSASTWYDISGVEPVKLESKPNDLGFIAGYPPTEPEVIIPASQVESVLTPDPVEIEAGEISELTIYLKDEDGNQLSNNGGVQDVQWSASPNMVNFGNTVKHNDGTITVSATSLMSGQYDISFLLIF